jgi:DNA (cytosine-5)-methyltransferase 1
MRYLSVCSGIEAASVAWHPLGWEAVAYSEVEPFPCSVLAHHYPQTPNWGDMTKWENWPDATVDVLVGGTPCQSYSVAGKRAGMDDPRGRLALSFSAIAGRYRPRFIVWENVPGVLSSGQGRDFGSFLGSLVNLGYGLSWRVLDARYFKLAQSRRRVFVVGCLGDWRRSAAVLFERESVRRCDPSGAESWQEVAGNVVPGVAGSLDTECGGGKLTHQSAANGHLIGAITARMFNALDSRAVEAGCLVPSSNMRVRKLMPAECEKLMGFPVGYTQVPHRGKPAADGPRYKSLGNSMAVPCMAWIGRRIDMVSKLEGLWATPATS